MKLLFVSLDIEGSNIYDPNYFPLGLLILSKITSQLGLEVELLDINELLTKNTYRSGIELVVDKIISINPDYIGFYSRSDLLPRVILVADLVKKSIPETKILVGGPGVFGIEEYIFAYYDFIDLIICGEGEVTIYELFKSGMLSKKLDKIEGIAFKSGNRFVKTNTRKLLDNLDRVPFPERLGCPALPKDYIPVEAGRGCPYNCSFCSTSIFWHRKYRVKSPEVLVDEVYLLMKQYDFKRFTFLHDNLTVSKEYIENLSKEILRREMKFQWGCCARIDNVDEKIISVMKESGCEHIYFGIETGSPKIQKSIGKNINMELIHNNLKLCDKYNMDFTISFVLGFPEEEISDINETLNLAIELSAFNSCNMIQLNYLQPTPITKITAENQDKLYIDDEQIMLSLNRRGLSKSDIERELELVRSHKELFSSYYKIRIKHKFDLYKAVFCFSHMLVYYRKTIQIICIEYKILPLDFFDFVMTHCDDCGNCSLDACDSTYGGNGICSKFDIYIEQLIPEITNFQKFIVKYETQKRNFSITNEYSKNII